MKRLPRTLGFWSSVGLVVGITIGSGIFRTPAGIARLLPSPMAMLARLGARRRSSRSVARFRSPASAGCCPRPAGSTPTCEKAGDGRSPFCLAGPSWCSSAPTPSAACPSFSGNTASGSFGIDPSPIRSRRGALAAAAIACAAAREHPWRPHRRGHRRLVDGGQVPRRSRCWWAARSSLGGAHGASIAHFRRRPRRQPGRPSAAGSLGLALVSVLWAYDGFADVSFAGGEVKDPAAEPAARHHRRHAGHHRALRPDERGLPLRSAGRRHRAGRRSSRPT